MKDLEHVCRLLAAWSGPGSSWIAKVVIEAATPGQPKVGFSVSRRGGVEEQATRGVRRLRRWTREAGVICTPVRQPHEEIAVTLSWIGSLHADLLLAFACEDVEAWRRYRARLGCNPVLADHAMASLMRPAKRSRVPGNELAQSVRMRAGAYYAERRRIEGWIEAGLHEAAAEFMRKLGGKSKYPENGMVNRGSEYRPTRHKALTPWWRGREAQPVLMLSDEEARRYCEGHPAHGRLKPGVIDPAEAARVVVPSKGEFPDAVKGVDAAANEHPRQLRRRRRSRATAPTATNGPRPRVRRLRNALFAEPLGWAWCRGPEFEFDPVLAEAA